MPDDPRFDRDAFIIDQPFTLWVNRYRVHATEGDGFEPGPSLAFCRQKALAFKEDLRFFTDEDMGTEVFRIKARRVVDIGGRYDVTDPGGAPIGTLERRASTSLLRTTWAILGTDGAELAVVRERSMGVAILRRVQNVVQLVPLAGWAVGLVMDVIPIPYHFDYLRDGTVIGTHTRKYGIRDRYRLEITGDPDRLIDRRLVVALGVGLDALQSR